MLKVLVVGQTPPPHGGQAIMIERLVKSRLPGVALLHARMAFSSHLNEVGRFRWSKVAHLLALIVRIVHARVVHNVRILYYPPAGPDRVPMYRDWAILLSTRWLFAKTIFHFHAGGVSKLYDQLPSWQRWLFRRAYFHADAAVRISDLNPEDGKRLEARREYVVPNGIDDPCPGLRLPRARATVTANRPLRILFVGILRESKGLLVLIEACGRLAARGVPFRLEIMGAPDGDEFVARVKVRVTELKLDRQVHFLGVLVGTDKFAAYARSDVYCMPTFYECETFGVVFIEAMACGLPVVATNWRGIPSIVEESETGFLVEPHDVGAVADRLAVLAQDPQLRERMGAAGREKFLREYTWPRHADRMRRVVLDVGGVEHAGKPEEFVDTCLAAP